MLMHPGINRTESTIWQHFVWPKLHEDVEKLCKTCVTCQKTNKTKKKYGHLPPKEAEATHWDTLCIDLIGPYTVKKRGKKEWKLHCLTMIDPATGWFEIAEISNKQADKIANVLEMQWLSRYPWPQKCICDRGREFMAKVTEMLEKTMASTSRGLLLVILKRMPSLNECIKRLAI